jgi:hypothetical protein
MTDTIKDRASATRDTKTIQPADYSTIFFSPFSFQGRDEVSDVPKMAPFNQLAL